MKRAPSNPIAASFDRAAPGYLAHASVQEALAAWLAEWAPEGGAGRAVEVGAGPGVFTRLLLPWKGEFTATDISPAMCAAGKSRLPQVRWRTLAAEALSGGPWDWIFSSSMLQWTIDPAAVFAAWRSGLAGGGRILGALFASGSLPEWSSVAAGTAPLVWRTVPEWRALIEGSGLRILRDATESRAFAHPSAAAFLRTLHGVGAAPARRFPAGRLRRHLRDYEARHRSGDGVVATWEFYRFEAANHPADHPFACRIPSSIPPSKSAGPNSHRSTSGRISGPR
jgi:SAM-dependent methyltransferase